MTDTTLAGATTAPAAGRKTAARLRTDLLASIQKWTGEWTTGRAAAHLGVHRYRARKALGELADNGQLIRHDRNGRRYFTLNHAPKDSTS